MTKSVSILCMVFVGMGVASAGAQVNVTQHHNHDSRDGLYIDPAFTPREISDLTAQFRVTFMHNHFTSMMDQAARLRLSLRLNQISFTRSMPQTVPSFGNNKISARRSR
jgi:hypothetical protein